MRRVHSRSPIAIEPLECRAMLAAVVADPLVALEQMGVPAAWEVATGSGSIVAVLDTCINWDVFADQVYTNPGEIEGDGIDNDANGFVDDVHGWDFANNDSDTRPGKLNHGTQVATTVLQVAPDCQILPIQVFQGEGGSNGPIIAGLRYVQSLIDAGSNIVCINMSFGGAPYDAMLDDAIADNDALVVAAAGNDHANYANWWMTSRFYPSDYPGVLSVGATVTGQDRIASYSRRGWDSQPHPWPSLGGVEVLAPGNSSALTAKGKLANFAGTSAAAPRVAGVAALVSEAAPGADRDALWGLITDTADQRDGTKVSGMSKFGLVRADEAVTFGRNHE